jgi:uncharacterized protein (TIGR02757 family)
VRTRGRWWAGRDARPSCGSGGLPCRLRDQALGRALDALYRDYEARPAATADPVHVARRYADPADREVVAFISAALAFGRVQSVLKTIGRVLGVMGGSPASFVRAFDPERQRVRFAALGHRWARGEDLAALLLILRDLVRRHGSIEAAFAPGDASDEKDVGPALERFSRRALAVDLRPAYGGAPRRPGVAYFFPRPSTGSACKRLNLFLRWVVRDDGIDLGLWHRVPASQLVVPLDTHVIRVGQALGLTRYRTPGWKMAAEITASLRRFDPADPTRYDFALCHLGMQYGCGVRCGAAAAPACPLRSFCRAPARTPRRSRPPSGPR